MLYIYIYIYIYIIIYIILYIYICIIIYPIYRNVVNPTVNHPQDHHKMKAINLTQNHLKLVMWVRVKIRYPKKIGWLITVNTKLDFHICGPTSVFHFDPHLCISHAHLTQLGPPRGSSRLGLGHCLKRPRFGLKLLG